MTPIESVSSVFRNYVNFNGRAQRSEFWWFALFSFIVSVILGIIATALPVLTFLEWVYSLAVLLPSLAVTVRRLHDTDRTAWWLLLYLIPVLGWIALLIMCALPGTGGPNRYGPNPLQSQQGIGAYGYGYPAPGHPYAPPHPTGSYSESRYDTASQDYLPEPGPGERRYCTQCGMQLQPEARFCNVCGAAV